MSSSDFSQIQLDLFNDSTDVTEKDIVKGEVQTQSENIGECVEKTANVGSDRAGEKLKESTQKQDKGIATVSTKGNSIYIGDRPIITFVRETVGTSSNSRNADFYVYEWFIKDSGEVFYVGKGRGSRYKDFHRNAYAAEEIKKKFITGVRFVAQNLTEEDALRIETEEISRILDETNDCLTNTITPFFTKRGNGYKKSKNTPVLKFETAPTFYVSEIEDHYFGIKPRSFDKVEYENLSHPFIIEKYIDSKELEIVYGGDYSKYYEEVVALLKQHGNTILKSKYASSVTAWIYVAEDNVMNYKYGQDTAERKLGRTIPVYHLIDVWKCLKERFTDIEMEECPCISIHPVHNRIPLSEVKDFDEDGEENEYERVVQIWEQGEEARKEGNFKEAILRFDQARELGFDVPALYDSYVKTYRKLKDLDNEIAILDEAIERFGAGGICIQEIIKYKEQRARAYEKLGKRRNN